MPALPMMVCADKRGQAISTSSRDVSLDWSKRIHATGSTFAKFAYLHFLQQIGAPKPMCPIGQREHIPH
jgi:hypothetical protein